MIIELLLNLLKGFVTLILNLFDLLPSVPTDFLDAVKEYIILFCSNISLLGFFIPFDFCLTLLICVLSIENFHYIYKLFMFVLRKIPFLNIE